MPDLKMFGHIIEGVVERDPLTDQHVIRTADAEGEWRTFDVQGALAEHLGKEIRLTLVSFENLARLAEIAESLGLSDQVKSVTPDDLPGVPFDVRRKDD